MPVSAVTMYCLCGHSDFNVVRLNESARTCDLKCVKCDKELVVTWTFLDRK